MDHIEIPFQLPGYCKKVKNKDIYRYPATPCMVYRLVGAKAVSWNDYPELKGKWDDQLKGVKIAKGAMEPLMGLPDDLWVHQATAIQWEKEVHSGLLWAGMGTGKSRIILELLNRNQQLKKVLIVCPLVVIDSWAEQVRKWSTVKFDVSLRKPCDNIVIQNYESLWRGSFSKWALKQQWDLVVLDECQKISNPGSKVSKFCSKINAKKKIAMSGTPFSSGPLDLFGVYKFLDPGMFGQSYKRFERKFAYTIEHKNYSQITGYCNREEYQNCLNFMCLKIESDVLDLPPVSYSTINVELPIQARVFYDEFKEEFVAFLDNEAMSAANILVKLIRLQGITSGIIKLDDSEDVQVLHDEKGAALKVLLEGLDEPVVVFGRFKHDLKVCSQVCQDLGRKYCEVSGQRKELDKFVDVIGVQIKSGIGIDLTKSSIAIFLSTGYSNADYEQAVARILRPPQNKPVRIIHIHCKNTIDKQIAEILQKKQSIIKELRK